MSNPIKPSTADSLVAVARNILENDLITETPFEDYFRLKDTKALVKRTIILKSFMFDGACHMSLKIIHTTTRTEATILNMGDITELYMDDECIRFTSDDYTFQMLIEQESPETPSEPVVLRPHYIRPDDIPVPMPGPWPIDPPERPEE